MIWYIRFDSVLFFGYICRCRCSIHHDYGVNICRVAVDLLKLVYYRGRDRDYERRCHFNPRQLFDSLISDTQLSNHILTLLTFTIAYIYNPPRLWMMVSCTTPTTLCHLREGKSDFVDNTKGKGTLDYIF